MAAEAGGPSTVQWQVSTTVENFQQYLGSHLRHLLLHGCRDQNGDEYQVRFTIPSVRYDQSAALLRRAACDDHDGRVQWGTQLDCAATHSDGLRLLPPGRIMYAVVGINQLAMTWTSWPC